jgi:geranylgeranyl reductase family protein
VDYDVIVIGAGPAGCAAAAELAGRGLKTALLEKHRLPRHKTCGGGVPVSAGTVLRDLAPEAFVEANVDRMRHTFHFEDPFEAAVNPPGSDRPLSLWMVQRSVFDNALAQRAAKMGADLRDGLAVREVETGPDGATVHATGQDGVAFKATARHVIGADGANGVAAKAAGLRKERSLVIAMEIEHPHVWGTGHESVRPDTLHLEFGAVPRGYAWVFPKGDHLNVGAGVFRPRREDGRGDSSVRPLLQKTIHQYMDLLSIPYDPEKLHYHAHPLPIWDGRETLHTRDGRILLAGDAAGLINPFFGDGILHAVRSGLIAAETLADGKAAEYTKRIHAEFAENFDAALRIAKFFYQFPGPGYRHGIKREFATRTATMLLCGDLGFHEIAGRVLRRLTAAVMDRQSAM